ncbi:hypothetical protein FSP39_005905 [Pinctada imbricata]|uniref:Palmitoyltransferase n=1 Tax=Pinctada imbricata TaxID=66713 RepID=A0AA88Y515_PINIB|nr:hypothetical protein FSP39_005905 [Pinctada imbricata]
MIQSVILLFRRNVPARTRLLAFGSILSMFYFCFMTFTVTALCWFEILPNMYRNNYSTLRNHRYMVAFFFINAIGNCILVLGTNTSINRFKKKVLIPFSIKEHAKKDKPQSKENGKNSECNEVIKRRRNKECQKEIKEEEREKSETESASSEPGSKICLKCNYRRPARSHHCIICDTCILKRDHHCFFMTVCIGYFNQKYFIMYCFYMLLGTFYGMILIVMYMNALFKLRFYGPQTFVTLLYELLMMMWTGMYPGGKYVFLLLLMYGSLTAGLLAASLWFWQMQIVVTGQTTHEAETGNKKYSAKSIISNFKEVFGRYWPLTLILPIPLPQCSNGLYLSENKNLKK